MKVGVLQFFSWPGRRVALDVVYDRALQRIEHMDASGYDAVWLAEHHFSDFSVCPSIHMMGTLVAARTQRIRIGMGVSLAAFYHPLRLAEEVALLDVLSGGRVNWGAGRGFARVEFEAFGVPADESQARFREGVDAVIKAWQHDHLTYSGEFFSCEDIEVLPKPAQDPHPPVWVAASSDGAIDWAAGEGHAIMLDPHSPHADIGRKRERYEAALGRREDRDMPMARLIAIDETSEKAEDVARAGATWLAESYAAPKHGAISDPALFGGPGADPVERYLDGIIVHGTRESVTEELLRLEGEIGLDYLLAAPLSHRTFEALTDYVLPRVVR